MRRFLLPALLIVSACISAKAQGRGFGLGIILGSPTGLSFKNYLTANQAVDGALGWNLWENKARIYGHADYLWHDFSLLAVPEGNLGVHYGPGVRLSIGDEAHVGLRFDAGLTYLLPSPALEFFGEVAPGIGLVPDTDFSLDVALGARFYFR